MRVVLPIGNSYIQVGLFGALLLLPVYGLWICCLLVWLPLKWTVLGSVSFIRWAFKPEAPFTEESPDGRQA